MAFRKITLLNGILIGILTISGDMTLGGFKADSDSLAVTKTANTETFTHVGEVITYTIRIQRYGTSDMEKISITDTLVEPCNSPLEVEKIGSSSCEVSYVITEEDMEAGEVTNTVTVKGYIEGICGTQGDWFQATDTVTIHIAEEMPSLELTKIGTPNRFYDAGEEITFTYTVKNTGNVVLVGPVTVTDDLVGFVCSDGDLQRGESMECTASYTTTADDVAATQIKNTAVATARVISSDPVSFVVYLEILPQLALTKAAYPRVFSQQNQLITYTFELENTGNVPISPPFEISDPKLENWTCPHEILAPGQKMTCTGVYYTRQGDVGGTIKNCAIVYGVFQGGQIETNEACAQVSYQKPQKPPSACDIDPDSQDCFCEKYPHDC